MTYATAPASINFKRLSQQQLDLSLQASLAHWDGLSDLWLFAYGSLIWRPDFHFIEQRPALVQGYHRSLCLWSRINRGTPDIPGVVFALDQGGNCEGIAYKIAANQVKSIFPHYGNEKCPVARTILYG